MTSTYVVYGSLIDKQLPTSDVNALICLLLSNA
uniref:Uncharacterized protein n=1 Tax=Podoviridae sp. ctUT63 TaxID=2825253 RepID=A0A8S5Q6B8_9CAUD|nr:MAG TPA: hypothetical protein [Podoviridae sp. ctUT63]DAI95013.1 MAG TPA: hypothetical protein [Caudoviricetes sp.]DAO37447.1 MAG TPA: hypothetical protein [Bacteriophage sp.]DAO93056.1 MAG TPA: hypothetical protein [Caudoviricetes sp.]DAP35360.1 MAG TPA: hypothetical protein [Caudoviricetes sp.]